MKIRYLLIISFLIAISAMSTPPVLADVQVAEDNGITAVNGSDSIHVSEKDSVTVTQLEELVVRSERRWFEGNKLVCIPTRQEKNVANSPQTLIEAMAIPTLKVEGDKVVDITGQVVPYYINGKKVDVTDISTFWPKDALRVEYIRNPTDPKYDGVPAVINFIMHEYEVGGVTKFDANQAYPLFGYYSASSKLAYKRMTYGALFDFGYTDCGKFKSENSEEFRDLYYDDKYYNSIYRDYSDESQTKSYTLNAAVNARYSDSKFESLHTLSLKYINVPVNSHSFSDVWSPDLFDSQSSYSNGKDKNLIPQISGYYGGYLIPKKWYLFGGWKYTFSRNNDYSINRIDGHNPIITDVTENVNRLQILLQPSFIPSPKWFFSLRMIGMAEWLNTKYTGTTDVSSRQKRIEFTGVLTAQWNPRENLQLALRPNLLLSRYNAGGYISKTIHPSASMELNWTPCSKLNFGTSLAVNYQQPFPSSTTDVLVRSSELFWLKGNPLLKNSYDTSGFIYATYMPLNWLTANFSAHYLRLDNNFIQIYNAAPSDMGGLICQTVNSSPEDMYTFRLNLDANILNNSLRFGFKPSYTHYRIHGAYAGILNTFYYEASVSYLIKNFSFSIQYNSNRKSLSNGGMRRTEMPYDLYLNATYGNGNWFVRFSISNVLRKYNWRHSVIDSQYYFNDLNERMTGRLFNINISYTFGYGKKIDRNINIETSGETHTGIVGK